MVCALQPQYPVEVEPVLKNLEAIPTLKVTGRNLLTFQPYFDGIRRLR